MFIVLDFIFSFLCLLKIFGYFFAKKRMSGFQIPLDLKIDFLENVVLPSLGVHPPFCENEARYEWMRKRAGERYSEHLEDLILAFNWICNWPSRTKINSIKARES